MARSMEDAGGGLHVAIRRLYRKWADLVDAVRTRLGRRGIRTVEDIYADIDRGEMARRENQREPSFAGNDYTGTDFHPSTGRFEYDRTSASPPPARRRGATEGEGEESERLPAVPLTTKAIRGIEHQLTLTSGTIKSKAQIIRNMFEGRPNQAGTVSEGMGSLYRGNWRRKASQLIRGLRETSTTELFGRRMRVGEKIYHYVENPYDERTNPTGVKLTDREMSVYDQVKPVIDYQKSRYEELLRQKGVDPADLENLDPHYMHRIVLGYDDGMGGDVDPISNRPRGDHRGALSRNAPGSMPRTFFTGVAEDGERKVFAVYKDGVGVWRGGRKEIIRRMTEEQSDEALDQILSRKIGNRKIIEGPGTEIKIGGKWYTIDHARTHEIEEQVADEKGRSIRYQKDFLVNSLANAYQLDKAIENAKFINWLTTQDFFKAHATLDAEKAARMGYRAVESVPVLRRWHMDPRIAEPLEDYAGITKSILGEGTLGTFLEGTGRFFVKTMFWQPFTHMINEISNAFVARGWANVNPVRMVTGVVDGMRAVYAVANKTEDYIRMQEAGAALLHSGISKHGPIIRDMLNSVGHTIEHDPSEFARWKGVANMIGVRNARDLANWWYRGVSHMLWGTHDILTMQRIFELQRSGLIRRAMTLPEAIEATDRIMATYRISSRILLPGKAGRIASKMFNSNQLFVFGRYHVSGKIMPWLNIVKGLKGDFGGRGFVDATGQAAVMAFIVYKGSQILNSIAQSLTGNQGETMSTGGASDIATRFVEEFRKPYVDRNYEKAWDSLFLLNPATREFFESLPGVNRDFFTGKPIREGDLGQQLFDMAEYGAGQSIQPLQTGIDWFSGQRSPIEQILGARRPPKPGAHKFNLRAERTARKDWQKDPVINMLNDIFGGSLPQP
jgi:hypothetical protein